MNIIGRRKIWFLFSGSIMAISLMAIALWGLKLGVDFHGGSLVEVSVTGSTTESIHQHLASLHLGSAIVQPTDRGTFQIRLDQIDEKKHQEILGKLRELGSVEERNFSTVG